jgi:hypothetical protein
VRLLPDDNASDFATEAHPYVDGALMLAHRPDGRCVYLDTEHFSIHARRAYQRPRTRTASPL